MYHSRRLAEDDMAQISYIPLSMSSKAYRSDSSSLPCPAVRYQRLKSSLQECCSTAVSSSNSLDIRDEADLLSSTAFSLARV